MEPYKVVIRHVRDVVTGMPHATIAMKQVGKTLYAGVAYCSPKDQFCKETGRQVATQRLVRQDQHSFKGVRSRSYNTNVHKVLRSELVNEVCPDFARRAVLDDIHLNTAYT